MRTLTRAALLLALGCLLLDGCATRRPAPVTERTPQQARTAPPAAVQPAAPAPQPPAGVYVVKPGDTLYSIALDHGLDYRELAAWNNLDNVSHIRVGQQLRLTAPGATAAPAETVTTAPLKTPGGRVESRPLDARGAPAAVPVTPVAPSQPGASNKLKTGPKATRIPYSDQTWAQLNKAEAPQPTTTVAQAKPEPKAEAKPEAKPDTRQDAVRGANELDWIWPTSGKVVSSFSDSANLKGIGIAGKSGQAVVASAPGRVVYSGSGLRGYGKLVIIKHNDTYLSVYAHNSELLVKEGQTVKRGQKIAEMGNTDSDQVKLHFEIRRYGKPVDPLKLLPGRG